MSTLEALIAEAAAQGRFDGLTLWRSSEGRWQAAMCASRTTCTVAYDTDPVAALAKVLGGVPAPSAEGLFD